MTTTEPPTAQYPAVDGAARPAPLPPAPRLGDPGAPCAQCGAPLAVDQRYCLNCGLRRGDARVDYQQLLGERLPGGDPTLPAPMAAAAAAPNSGDRGARAITPLHAAAGLGLLLLAVIAGSILGRDGAPAPAQNPIVLGGAPTTPATTPTSFTSDWTGSDGWTVQLQVLPKDGTTPEQIAQAKTAATGQGATEVGALDSDTYPSLDPGSYVIYSGVYASKGEAKDALKALEDKFPDAAVVEVSTTAASEETADEEASGDAASDDALKGLENASPDAYVEQSRKLPDEVGTEGEAPPEDNKAPDDGGNDSATIG